ncbi:DNA cytosine methyltransferase [Nocardioides KLBMP 9356]|uniref:DNA (cytosine-5-)-methyltransferase n=1 Tax=Nocardioides potassii TaxID=2911371 RepID=A0ABS9H910_9ACTN|nr:DNA cytosine methyltransferase [Nocardioides potassii]MCF6376919.1 DNA cytosine methyltransferase [Nocardioides potassii]
MLTITDLFCGGGGSSTGAVQVPGVEIKIAANHWDLAVQVHNENHPTADHAAVDLHEEDPRYFPRTDILWASPECTKWSQASGGKYSNVPASLEPDLFDALNPELVDEDPETAIVQRSRLLMFDVLRFAEHHRYKAMVIENVVDVATNPKYADAWMLWKKGLRNLGYDFRIVSLNSMHAQAHGDPAPQSRDRLYVVCWLKGNRAPDIDKVMRPLAWCPECQSVVEAHQAWKNGRTVGKYRSQYVYLHAACGTAVEPGYLPAAAAIDWSLRGTRIGDRAKPLADKTRRRIAAGIARYWSPFHMEQSGNQYDAADVKHPQHGDPNSYYRVWSMYDVLRTLHTIESKALVVPLEGRAGDRVSTAEQALRTQTSRHQDAFVTRAEWGGQDWPTTYDTASLIEPPAFLTQFRDRVRDLDPREKPLPTVVADGANHGLVQHPFIAELRGGGSDARSVESPMSTVTASGNHHALIQANNHNNRAHPISEPLPTATTATGGGAALVMPYYGSSQSSQPVEKPIGTLTTVDRYALIHRNNSGGAEMTTPASEYLRTLTTAGHQSVITPGDIEAAAAQVDDCLFRMLEPHEVAAGMAFPADYIWGGTRRERVKLAGNAVTPPAARDLIAAVVEALS